MAKYATKHKHYSKHTLTPYSARGRHSSVVPARFSQNMLISPLARKLCTAKGIDPTTLRGTGPRGRIMAADVIEPKAAPQKRGGTAIADFSIQPTRPEKDGYYVYDDEVNMQALADISLPIAVQCEKLLENRYSLFDYIVRAVVKACCAYPSWQDAGGKINVLLFESEGEKKCCISDAAKKSIFRIARETANPTSPESDFSPHIVICDTHTTREQVAATLQADKRPGFALVVRGNTPKDGIRAGRDHIDDMNLGYTFYAATTISAAEANRIAAHLRALLYNPVRLLLLN